MKKAVERGTKKQIAEAIKAEASKSQKIKNLFDLGLEVKEIADLMGIRYNFAYNVISNYINMNDLEVIKEEKADKKQAILELHSQGMNKINISKTLKTNYNYVFKVLKEAKEVEAEAKAE